MRKLSPQQIRMLKALPFMGWYDLTTVLNVCGRSQCAGAQATWRSLRHHGLAAELPDGMYDLTDAGRKLLAEVPT